MSAKIEVFGYNVDLMEELGRGGFGTVYKGFDKDNKPYAIKRVCKENTNEISEAVRCQYFKDNINHRQIAKVHTVENFKDSMWIIMEYCDLGDLNQYFKKYNPQVKNIQQKAELMYQIISGVNFLHEKNIAHRDIKPGNILVKSTQDGKPEVKLGDFGLSKILDPDCLTSAMTSNVGTHMFKAPEFWDKKLGDKVRYHRNVDVYSSGLTFAAMLQAKQGHQLVPKPDGSLYVSETNIPVGLVTCTRHANRQPELAIVTRKPEDNFKTKMIKELVKKMTSVSPYARLASYTVQQEMKKIVSAETDMSVDEEARLFYHVETLSRHPEELSQQAGNLPNLRHALRRQDPQQEPDALHSNAEDSGEQAIPPQQILVENDGHLLVYQAESTSGQIIQDETWQTVASCLRTYTFNLIAFYQIAFFLSAWWHNPAEPYSCDGVYECVTEFISKPSISIGNKEITTVFNEFDSDIMHIYHTLIGAMSLPVAIDLILDIMHGFHTLIEAMSLPVAAVLVFLLIRVFHICKELLIALGTRTFL